MAAHGIVAAGAEDFLHPRTRFAGAGVLQQAVSHAELAAFEGQEIQTDDDQIAAEKIRVDFRASSQAGDGSQMLVLDQRDLAFAAGGAAQPVITGQAASGEDFGSRDGLHRGSRGGAESDPDKFPDLRQGGEEFGDGLHGGLRVSGFGPRRKDVGAEWCAVSELMLLI